MAVQNIRQEFAHNIEAGCGDQRETGVGGDIVQALKTGRSPNTGNRASRDDAGYARNGKGAFAVGMLRYHSAESRVAGPCCGLSE